MIKYTEYYNAATMCQVCNSMFDNSKIMFVMANYWEHTNINYNSKSRNVMTIKTLLSKTRINYYKLELPSIYLQKKLNKDE